MLCPCNFPFIYYSYIIGLQYNIVLYLCDTFQIKSAVASIEDIRDGPLDEELDEITKVCAIVFADIYKLCFDFVDLER